MDQFLCAKVTGSGSVERANQQSATEISRSMKEYIVVTSTNTQALVDATNRLRDVEISPIKISRSIDKIVAKMEVLSDSVEQTNTKLGSAFTDVGSVSVHLDEVKRQLNSLATKIDDSSKIVSDEIMKVGSLTQSATGYLENIKVSAEELARNTSETTSVVLYVGQFSMQFLGGSGSVLSAIQQC
jgi:uncharacterized protein YoxC